MGEMEDSGYVRLSRPGALFAFHTDAGGTTWVNLRWLADIVRHYETGDKKLTIPEPQDAFSAKDELEFLRPAVDRVDAERVTHFAREHDHR
jgi:hypothetical protein